MSNAVPETTRVVACTGGAVTRMEERPVAPPEPGEVLVRLRAVGFCGTDLFKLDAGQAAPGLVLGHEIVGDVAAVGPGVDAFEPGDRIAVPHHVPCGACVYCRGGNPTMCATFKENLMAPGGFSDWITIRPRAVRQAARRVPDAVTDAQAVFMEPAACVLRGVDRADVPKGGVACVMGAGSMGLLHLLTLRAARPDVAAVMVDPVAERRNQSIEMGAAASAEPGEAALNAVRAATGGAGADAVFDTVGGAPLLRAGLDLTRAGGSVVLFAHAPDGQAADFDLNALFKAEKRIIGTYSGALDEQARVFDLIVSGALDPTPLVTHTMPLDDFETGVGLARARTALKVLFTPSRSGGAS
jgi:L-iditol 2-dehydrogenase